MFWLSYEELLLEPRRMTLDWVDIPPSLFARVSIEFDKHGVVFPVHRIGEAFTTPCGFPCGRFPYGIRRGGIAFGYHWETGRNGHFIASSGRRTGANLHMEYILTCRCLLFPWPGVLSRCGPGGVFYRLVRTRDGAYHWVPLNPRCFRAAGPKTKAVRGLAMAFRGVRGKVSVCVDTYVPTDLPDIACQVSKDGQQEAGGTQARRYGDLLCTLVCRVR